MIETAAERADRRAKLAIGGVIALGVLLRLVVLRSPGFPSDVATFQAWAERLAEIGPSRFYEPGYFSDYPPGYLYVLWIFGALFDGEFLRLVVKAASIPADVAIAVMSARLVWQAAGRSSAVFAAGLWMLSPGPIFAGPYWGQVDAVGTVPLLAALVMGGRGRWASAGVLAGVAAMVKPQFGIAAIVVLAAAAIVWIRSADWRAPARALIGAGATALLLGLPFRAGPGELIDLVKSAAATYPYTSLYAFNIWSIVGDFWKPDDAYVVTGAVLLVAGIAGSCLLLWWRRDVAALLAVGGLAALAFYFLPTRAHERYLFPAFALLLPLAATRARLIVPYVALAVSFAVSLYFAFTRYPQNDLRSPQWLEDTLFTRNGQIVIALAMLGLAGYIGWRLIRGDATLERDLDVGEGDLAAATAESRAGAAEEVGAAGEVIPRRPWKLPAMLALGRPPTRRDLAVALLVALVVLGTRGFRLDQPRDMYFDEVYHARTAFELLAQREPYEWTHPHLAKEIMALGILAFGDDRVAGTEPGIPAAAFAVTNDGLRVYLANGVLSVVDRGGPRRDIGLLGADTGLLAVDGRRIYTVTSGKVTEWSVEPQPSNAKRPTAILPPGTTATGLLATGGKVVVSATNGQYIYTTLDAEPLIVPRPAVAITAKPDGTTLFLLEAAGTIHQIDTATGQDTQTTSARGPGVAIAYALAPNRLFIARADTPALDVVDLDAHSSETVALGNDRTGAFTAGASELAVVTRTQFVYALTPGKVVVVETHGASPFASIPVGATDRFLGVDGEDDKLLVAGGETVERIETGRHALAWRLPGVVFAALLAFFLFLLARRLFASPLVAYLVGAATILDGSMFAQARIGMNDIYVATFIVATWYFIVAAHPGGGAPVQRAKRAWRGRAWVDILIAGVLIGLGAASKWAALYTLAGIFVASVAVTAYAYERGRPGTGGPLDLLKGRGRNAALLFGSFAVIPAALYLVSYVKWFGGPTAPYGWNLVELTQQMYWYHSSLTAPHCAGAPWWAWPLDLKPVYWYFGGSAGGLNGYIYDAGNPILFWLALPASAIVGGLAVRARSATLGLVVLAMLTQYVAWIPISRVLFFYHFFTVLPFYLLCLAIVLALFWERRRTGVLVLGGIAAAAFLFFYPFVSGMPIPGDAAGVYFILPTWQYDPAFYPTDSCPTAISASFGTSLTVSLAWALELAALALGAAIAFDWAPARRALARIGI